MYNLLTVVENWQPKDNTRNLMHHEIWEKFREVLRGFDPKFSPSIVVRDPLADLRVREAKDDSANSWHQDCSKADMLMIIWASVEPTLIRPIGGGSEVEGIKDGDILILSNILYEHKAPTGALGKRWFARTTVRQETCNNYLGHITGEKHGEIL